MFSPGKKKTGSAEGADEMGVLVEKWDNKNGTGNHGSNDSSGVYIGCQSAWFFDVFCGDSPWDLVGKKRKKHLNSCGESLVSDVENC